MSHLPQPSAFQVKIDLQREKRILEILANGVKTPSHSKPTPKRTLRRQRLLLDHLNNDVLAIIVDFVFETDSPLQGCRLRSHKSTLALSLTNRRLRAMCIPVLFRDVFRATPSMGELNYRLRDLEGNPMLPETPHILSYVRTCEIITTSRHTNTFCRTRLARTLPKMSSLLELSIVHRKEVDVSGLKATFEKAGVTLPSIVGLRIQSYSSWSFLVEACPSVEVLVLADNLYHEDMVKAVNNLSKLYHLELSSETWCLKDIEHLARAVPQLRSLALKGEINKELMSTFADAFGRMKCLETLAVATIQHMTDQDLEDQFSDDGPGHYDCWMEMQEEDELDEDQRKIARAYFRSCDKLETLYLVRFCSSSEWQCTRSPDGSVEEVYSPQGEKVGIWASWKPGHDSHGFPKVLWFPTQSLIWRDEEYPNIAPVATKGKAFKERLKERNRYSKIKYDALCEGLWEGGSSSW